MTDTATSEAKRDFKEESFQRGYAYDLAEALAEAEATIGDFAARLTAGKRFDCLFGSEIGRAVEAIATINVLNALEKNPPATNRDLGNKLADGLSNAAIHVGHNGGGTALLETATVRAWRNLQSRLVY